jgi:hypothetical protein
MDVVDDQEAWGKEDREAGDMCRLFICQGSRLDESRKAKKISMAAA